MKDPVYPMLDEEEKSMSEQDMLKQGLNERCSITHRTRANPYSDERVETTGGDYIKGHDDDE